MVNSRKKSGTYDGNRIILSSEERKERVRRAFISQGAKPIEKERTGVFEKKAEQRQVKRVREERLEPMDDKETSGGRTGKRNRVRGQKLMKTQISMTPDIEAALRKAAAHEDVSASLLVQEVLAQSPRIIQFLDSEPS